LNTPGSTGGDGDNAHRAGADFVIDGAERPVVDVTDLAPRIGPGHVGRRQAGVVELAPHRESHLHLVEARAELGPERRAVTPATLQTLAAPVRELARWLGRRGVPAYVLPKGALPRPARYVPHVYTDQELAALFTQTDRCRYCAQVPLRHLVMPVLFRTIYACGLRASEARRLRATRLGVCSCASSRRSSCVRRFRRCWPEPLSCPESLIRGRRAGNP